MTGAANWSRWCSMALAGSLAVAACDGDDGKGDDDKAGDGAPGDGSSPDPAPAGDPSPSGSVAKAPELKGPLQIPAAVPKGASAVLAVRVPKSLLATFVGADPMGIASADFESLQEELDDHLRDKIGITVTGARTVAAFLQGKEPGLVLEGIEGSIKGTKVGSHGGVDIYALVDNEEFRAAAVGSTLIVASESGIEAALDAHNNPDKSFAAGNDELAKLLAAESDGAAAIVGVDLTTEDGAMLAKQLPPMFKIDRGVLSFGAGGVSLLLQGDEGSLESMEGMVKLALDGALAEVEKERDRAKRKDGAEAAALGSFAILGAHYMKQAIPVLTPKVQGNELRVKIPFTMGDPSVLAALTGISAAIAVPAFTKYMRRSKTSEARVQLAKMFDAASAYFNEEHVSRAEVSILGGGGTIVEAAPHKCPNNGKLEGESGITPPLSVDCSKGPGGRCVPAVGGGGGEGYYDMALWADNDVWNGLNFQQEQAHYFHYNFKYKNAENGFGECQFTAQAFGDLDGDGVFSTYERSGAADHYGVNAAAGLYIDQEVE